MICDVSGWPVAPMEPVPRGAPFDDGETFFEVKWDGVRVLSYVYPDGRVRLCNRRLAERTAHYPEIAAALSGLPPGTVLDGEVVAPDASGRPDFPRVLRRDLARPSGGDLQAAVPVRYMVFDLLWLGGDCLCAEPLCRRRELLNALPFPPSAVSLTESLRGAGTALFAAVNAEGLEGVVAKKAASPYRIGRKSPDWQKIKCFRRMWTIVGGFLAGGPRAIRSLLAGLPEEGALRYVGAVSSGLTGRQRDALAGIFDRMPGPCPFVDPPLIPEARWVLPLVRAQVRFLEYTPGGLLRAPSVTAIGEAEPWA